VIIGGGYTGLSAALHLARKKQDWKVGVFESHEIGWGASGRNAGFCEVAGTYFSGPFGTDDLKRKWMRIKGESVQLVEQLATDYGIPIEKTGDGIVKLVKQGNNSEAILERHRAMYINSEGAVQCEEWNPEPDNQGVPLFAEGAYAGLIVRPGFGINPLRYVIGLAEAARRKNVQLYTHSRVLGVTPNRETFSIETEGQGTFNSKYVLIATNGYTPVSFLTQQLFPANQFGNIRPRASNIITTEELSEDQLAQYEYHTTTPIVLLNYHHYPGFWFRRLENRRILFGAGSIDDYQGYPPEQMYGLIEAWMRELFPAWDAVRVTHRWTGLACDAKGGLPFIGQSPVFPRLFYALGYNGTGIALATWSGVEVANMILHSRTVDLPALGLEVADQRQWA
jgi:glycine/D-amino acid oxidase-like deaminating enzyme